MSARRMFRYVVSADDGAHVIPLSGNPVAVAPIGPFSVEVWAEHTNVAPQVKRVFQVFRTGQPLPEGARWAGTCSRTAAGFVWHLYEVTECRHHRQEG